MITPAYYSRAITQGRLIVPWRRSEKRFHKPVKQITETEKKLIAAAICAGMFTGEIKSHLRRVL